MHPSSGSDLDALDGDSGPDSHTVTYIAPGQDYPTADLQTYWPQQRLAERHQRGLRCVALPASPVRDQQGSGYIGTNYEAYYT